MFKELTIEGNAGALDKLIDHLVAHLAAGWSRDAGEEERVTRADPLSGPRYAFRAPGRAIVFLRRAGDRFALDNIIPPEIGQLTKPQYHEILDDFADRFLRPAADKLGLTITITPDLHPTYWLGNAKATRLLREFLAGLPLSGHDLDRERWFAFLIQAHRGGADPDSGPFRRYLIKQEMWAEDHADRFASQYNFAQELLIAHDRAGGQE